MLETVVRNVGVADWIVIQFLTVVITAILSSTITMFLNHCYQSGMIFRRYYVYLNYLWIKWRKGNKRKYRAFLKPLGLCNVCSGTWIYILTYIVLNGLNLGLVLGLGVNYVLIEYINKKIQ